MLTSGKRERVSPLGGQSPSQVRGQVMPCRPSHGVHAHSPCEQGWGERGSRGPGTRQGVGSRWGGGGGGLSCCTVGSCPSHIPGFLASTGGVAAGHPGARGPQLSLLGWPGPSSCLSPSTRPPGQVLEYLPPPQEAPTCWESCWFYCLIGLQALCHGYPHPFIFMLQQMSLCSAPLHVYHSCALSFSV